MTTLLTYTEAKAIRDDLETAAREATAPLDAFPRGPMGLTPDAVKASAAYRDAKAAYAVAFEAQRRFNRWFTKTFKKEILAERRARR